MISWFDIAYAILDGLLIFYCFENYWTSRRKAFLFLGLGFIILMISDFLWVFGDLFEMGGAFFIYGYVRFVLYAAFVFFIIYSIRIINLDDGKKAE